MVAHGWQSFKGKAWWMWPLVIGTALEWIGYLTRLVKDVQVTEQPDLHCSTGSIRSGIGIHRCHISSVKVSGTHTGAWTLFTIFP